MAGKFGGELNLAVWRSILQPPNFLLTYIRMAIPYRTAKFKSANILAIPIWAQQSNLIPANISGYTVVYHYVHVHHTKSYNVQVALF